MGAEEGKAEERREDDDNLCDDDDAEGVFANTANMRARTATSEFNTSRAGPHRSSERFFLRHSSAKGERPFKLTDDMKNIIFGGASALPEWVSQENERGARVDMLRGSKPQTRRTNSGSEGFKSLAAASRQEDVQQADADDADFRAWGFPLPKAARRGNAVAPSDVYGSERGLMDAPFRPHFDVKEAEVGLGRSTSMRAPPSRLMSASRPAEDSRSDGYLHWGLKMLGETIPMKLMGTFYKMTVPPEPLQLQVPKDPEVREKVLVQGLFVTSLFMEIQQRNSHYLRLLLALVFVSFYFLVVYWQADVESKYAVASSVSKSFLVTLPLQIENIGVFLRLAINSVWTDINCGNGFCDAPYEFPQFGDLGCMEDCGKETNLVNLLVVIEGNFANSALGEMASEGLRASASWNLCFEDPKRSEYGLEDLCYFPEPAAFQTTAVVISEEFVVPPTLNWYVQISKDYYRSLQGRVYVLGNSSSVEDVEITPSWSSCSAQRV